jgi:2-polyprenyl-3-methyl-5-hydroxy-6-metoxy-1,4-benzoquinol methylase
MDDDQRNEGKIIASWRSNAAPWTAAVRRGQIESRQLITDRAIIEAVLQHSPRSVLDLGCGEGWLARALSAHGIRVLGVDAVAALIEQAQRSGGGEFRLASYEQIAAGEIAVRSDVVVCNFALLGKSSVEGLLRAMPSLLEAQGRLIIQTLHPVIACGEAAYQDGWREGSWRGFDAAFVDPAPWYFRTMQGWIKLLADRDLRLLQLREPLHPTLKWPASVIFIAALAGLGG